ncbi:MAG: hypothetical protein ACI4RJ_02660, partial [Alphaproteobacteria bacterium]
TIKKTPLIGCFNGGWGEIARDKSIVLILFGLPDGIRFANELANASFFSRPQKNAQKAFLKLADGARLLGINPSSSFHSDCLTASASRTNSQRSAEPHTHHHKKNTLNRVF